MRLLGFSLLLVAGCSCGGGSAPDGGTDAATVDAFTIDSTVPPDAPVADATITDARVADARVVDAPVADAPAGDAGPCTDDAREDDDTLAAAVAASAVYSLDGTVELPGLVACPGDDDFIHGYADCCDDPLGAEITWAAADGVLELTVLAPDGTAWPVDDEVTAAGRARRVETATAMGHDFIVRVHNPGATPIAYDATIYARVFGP